jgi:hypothetical protein
MLQFKAKIEIIGVNPYVLLPEHVLAQLFVQAGKDKGKIPLQMTMDGHRFTQTLVKYAGHWRLYLNTPMRKAAGKDVGDTAIFEVAYDPEVRTIAPHPRLVQALAADKDAKAVYDGLRPSLQLEIVRYISFLKTEKSVDRNVLRAIDFLLGKGRFIGRDGIKRIR